MPPSNDLEAFDNTCAAVASWLDRST